jgi:hypothetical protein
MRKEKQIKGSSPSQAARDSAKVLLMELWFSTIYDNLQKDFMLTCVTE